MRWALSILAIAVTLPAYAQPFAVLEKGAARITLYNEPCALEHVSNLRHRATWDEDNRRYEGCFGVFLEQAVGAYFDDKQVAVIPVESFVLTGRDGN